MRAGNSRGSVNGTSWTDRVTVSADISHNRPPGDDIIENFNQMPVKVLKGSGLE
jgi:hypothetical protein